MIINESVARRFFPGQDPLGRAFRFGPDPTDQYQIVGQVSDTRDINLNAPPRPQVYFPLLQDAYNAVNIMVRSDLEPSAAMAQLQKSVWSVDQDQPLTHVCSMAEVISTSVAQPRFRTWLVLVAMGASYIPARRATKVDPMVALRHE